MSAPATAPTVAGEALVFALTAAVVVPVALLIRRLWSSPPAAPAPAAEPATR